uniref:C2H2-type domain-containing protein n=1 Tax=Daphnia galeata TaxID=27404 RepID=A0A8J2RL05_9CRUS|nr:unnamed protein product [Daphnia galeata]
MAAIGNNTFSSKSRTQPTTPGQKGAVVCEICDSSIKDLEQLRHHMQWIHKVKIHPKMIHNRPPLNCQKCQKQPNRGQDGGRCPICGKVHQWKMLSHVVKDHGLSLKPAHLSYKCTLEKFFDKDKADTKKGSSGSTNTSTTGALRINDEITIIPQTARHDSSDQNVCRPSRGEKRSRVDII